MVVAPAVSIAQRTESLRCTRENNVTLCISYIEIKKLKKKEVGNEQNPRKHNLGGEFVQRKHGKES